MNIPDDEEDDPIPDPDPETLQWMAEEMNDGKPDKRPLEEAIAGYRRRIQLIQEDLELRINRGYDAYEGEEAYLQEQKAIAIEHLRGLLHQRDSQN